MPPPQLDQLQTHISSVISWLREKQAYITFLRHYGCQSRHSLRILIKTVFHISRLNDTKNCVQDKNYYFVFWNTKY